MTEPYHLTNEDLGRAPRGMEGVMTDDQRHVLTTLSESGDLGCRLLAHDVGLRVSVVRSALLHIQQHRLVTQVGVAGWRITNAGLRFLIVEAIASSQEAPL